MAKKTTTTNKKRVVKVDAYGEAHISSTFNNVIISLTNSVGQVISWSSAGKSGFRGSKKNTPYAAQVAAADAAKTAYDLGLRKVKAYVKGPGAGRESAIRTIHGAGIEVTEIIDVTPMPHRRFGEPIFGTDKDFEKRNYPPGQHGLARKRKKLSEYGVQLKEKQKVKYTYGLLERQFRNLYEKASRMKGQKGENLIQLLESRLDNIVYRLGIAPTRAAARQLVIHCHITLNGVVCNVPSALVKPGDTVAVRERSKSLEVIQNSVASAAKYSWLEFDAKELTGKYLNYPVRAEIPENITEQLIVELYSK